MKIVFNNCNLCNNLVLNKKKIDFRLTFQLHFLFIYYPIAHSFPVLRLIDHVQYWFVVIVQVKVVFRKTVVGD